MYRYDKALVIFVAIIQIQESVLFHLITEIFSLTTYNIKHFVNNGTFKIIRLDNTNTVAKVSVLGFRYVTFFRYQI